MKKIIILLAICLPLTAMAKDKKKKEVAQPAAPAVVNDSISYAVGVLSTDGLMPYLQQQMKVDSAYMADFIEGFNQYRSMQNDPKQKAFAAGIQIGAMVENSIYPRMTQQLPDPVIDDEYYKGFAAMAAGKSLISMDDAKRIFEGQMEIARRQAEAEKEAYKKENEDWLENNKKQEGVITTASGLQYKVITEGKGEMPASREDVFTVKYAGRLIDGTEFDNSEKHGDGTATFSPSGVIAGWGEALMMMPVGSKWQIYVPQSLGYGMSGAGKTIKPYSTLIFDLEVIGLKKAEPKKEVKEEPAAKKPATKKPVAKKTTKK